MNAMVPLKQWAAEKAMREGLKPHAIYRRMYRGGYPDLRLERKNKRVVFVALNPSAKDDTIRVTHEGH